MEHQMKQGSAIEKIEQKGNNGNNYLIIRDYQVLRIESILTLAVLMIKFNLFCISECLQGKLFALKVFSEEKK
jgi:hypothetical protein